MKTLDYEVIIIGGGPTGLAMGIELGLLGIKAAIFEKYPTSLLLPKAQTLNPRTMEFFRRWGINQKLISKKLLPPDYPIQTIWCSGMAGELYGSANVANYMNDELSPETYQRIPLWITEQVLRERLKDFDNVNLFKNHEMLQIEQNQTQVTVTIVNRETNQQQTKTAQYVIACDGAHSLTRHSVGIEMQAESAPQKVISVVFSSQALKDKTTLPKGILYYNLHTELLGAIGCVDYTNNEWYAQIFSSPNDQLNDSHVSACLDGIAGFKFNKTIKHAEFWIMQAQVATHYRKERILLVGDAAHTLPPTGGHGLNTGMGDVVNLGWKLATVLRREANDDLLDSYEIERKPIALRNMNAAKKNAQDARQIRELYPPQTMPREFAKENERLAKQHTISLGVALGYCYQNSPLISFDKEQHYVDDFTHYQPVAAAGFFAPHSALSDDKCLYDHLPIGYTLLSKSEIDPSVKKTFPHHATALNILKFPSGMNEKLYSKQYYLLRPDWHIAWVGDVLPNEFNY